MERGHFTATSLLGDVFLMMKPFENGIPSGFTISPEQARALAKALTKAAKAAEKSGE